MKHGTSIFIGSCVGILTAEDSEDVKISVYIKVTVANVASLATETADESESIS